MKKAEIRQRGILDQLIKKGEYSQEDIMKDYGISLRSMKSDIAFLNAQGHNIESVKGVYHLIGSASDSNASQKPEDSTFYDFADRKKIRKLILTLIISASKDGYTANYEGVKAISKKMSHPDDGVENNVPDISRTIENTLEDMLEDGELLISGGKYVLTATSPIQMPLSENDAITLMELIGDASKGNPYEEILNGIEDKLEIALLGQDVDQKQYTKRVLQGGKVAMDRNLQKVIEKLEAAHYTENQIIIKHKTVRGVKIEVEIAVGILLYVLGKKKMYLIGETGSRRVVIDCSRIEEVSALDRANSVFKSEEYKELAETMFEISGEDPVHVKVRFDNIRSIKDKLLRVVSNRKYASLYEQDGSFIYEDEISGISDFAHFIRGFGYGAEVIEPLELREKMAETAERILLAYGQEL